MNISGYIIIAAIIFIAYTILRLIHFLKKEKTICNSSISNINQIIDYIDKNKIINITKELESIADDNSFSKKIFRSGKTALAANMVYNENTIKDVANSYFLKFDNHITTIIRSFTVIGLIFTFIGLVISIGSSSQVLNEISTKANIQESNLLLPNTNFSNQQNVGNAQDQFQLIIDGLGSTLGGVVLAFSTSLMGLILSLFFGLYFSGRIKKRDELINNSIFELSIRVIPLFSFNNPDAKVGILFDNLTKQIVSSLEGFYNLQNKMFKAISDEINKLFDQQIKSNKTLLDETLKGIKELNKEYIKISKDHLNNFKEIKEFASIIKKSSSEINNASTKFNKHISNFEKLSEPLQQINLNLESFKDGLNTFFRHLEALSINDPVNAGQLNNLNKLMHIMNLSLQEISLSIKSYNNSGVIEKLNEMIKKDSTIFSRISDEYGINKDSVKDLLSIKEINEILKTNLSDINKVLNIATINNNKISSELGNLNTNIKKLSNHIPNLNHKDFSIKSNGTNWFFLIMRKLFVRKGNNVKKQ